MTMFESVWFQSDQKQSFNENIFLQKIMWLLAYRILGIPLRGLLSRFAVCLIQRT